MDTDTPSPVPVLSPPVTPVALPAVHGLGLTLSLPPPFGFVLAAELIREVPVTPQPPAPVEVPEYAMDTDVPAHEPAGGASHACTGPGTTSDAVQSRTCIEVGTRSAGVASVFSRCPRLLAIADLRVVRHPGRVASQARLLDRRLWCGVSTPRFRARRRCAVMRALEPAVNLDELTRGLAGSAARALAGARIGTAACQEQERRCGWRGDTHARAGAEEASSFGCLPAPARDRPYGRGRVRRGHGSGRLGGAPREG
jgi:hypothetical protein